MNSEEFLYKLDTIPRHLLLLNRKFLYKDLVWASNYGKSEIVKRLLEYADYFHIKDNYCLLCAAMNGHIEVVKLLLEYGLNVDDICLYWADYGGYVEIVKLLKEHMEKQNESING